MAREKAKQTVCMNNLKQIGIAYAMYAQDNNDCIPARVGGTTYNSYGPILWGGSVANAVNAYGPLGLLVQRCGNSTNGFGTGKYISTPAILFCPSAPTQTSSGSWGVPTLANFRANFENTGAASLTWGSYTVNCDDSNPNAVYPSAADGPYGSGGGTLTGCNLPTAGAAIKRYACAADVFAPGIGTTSGSTGIYYHLGGGLSSLNVVMGFNVLYFDGSVQWWTNSGASTNPPGTLINAGDTTNGNIQSTANNKFWQLVETKQ
jgi:prepilin-type processing-associated H-X9-DG protein